MAETDVWGFHSGHYDGFTKNQIQQLEKAIRLGYCGFDKEAIEISNTLRTVTDHPVVFVELASIYFRMGLETKAAEFLGSLSRPGPSQKPLNGADCWDLINIMRANCDFYAFGTASSALSTAIELYLRLLKKDAQSFSSIDALCFSFCNSIFALCTYAANLQDDGHIPELYESARREKASTIRKILSDQGQLNLAAYLALDEPELNVGVKKLTAFEEILEAQSKEDFLPTKSNLVCLGNFLTHYVDELVLLRKSKEAQYYLRKAKEYYVTGLDLNSADDMETAAPRQWVWLRRASAQVNNSESGSLGASEQQIRLALSAEYHHCYRVARLHYYDAIRLLESQSDRAVYIDGSTSKKDMLEFASESLIEMEEHTVGSAFFLATAIPKYKGLANITSEPAVFQDNIARFWKRFPRFDVPSSIALLTLVKNMTDMALGARISSEDHENTSSDDTIGFNVSQNVNICRGYSYVSDMTTLMSRKATMQNGLEATIAYVVESAIIGLFWFVKFHLENQYLSPKEAASLLRLEDAQYRSNSPDTLWDIQDMQDLPFSVVLNVLSGLMSSASIEDWDSWYEVVQNILNRDFPDKLTKAPTSHAVLYNLRQIRGLVLRREGLGLNKEIDKGKAAYQIYLESQKMLHLLESSELAATTEQEVLLAQLEVAESINSLPYHQYLRETEMITEGMMIDAFDRLESLRRAFLVRGDLFYLYKTNVALADNLRHREWHFTPINTKRCLFFHSEADKTFRRMQAERSSLEPSRSLLTKDIFSQNLGHNMCYTNAISILFKLLYDENFLDDNYGIRAVFEKMDRQMEKMKAMLGNKEQPTEPEPKLVDKEKGQALRIELATWVQKFKARNLTDLLGLESRVAARFLVPSPHFDEASEMLVKEQKIKEDIQGSSISSKLKLKSRLEQHQQKMWADFPNLRSMLSVREGRALTSEDIEALGRQLGKDTVFVDWFYVQYSERTSQDLGMVFYRNGRVEAVCSLASKMGYVQDWIQEHLDQEKHFESDPQQITEPVLISDSSSEELNALKGLIKPLEIYTTKGETLVLCPTRDLFRIPLHALPIEGQRLIERNPIVYAQSLSLFRLCHFVQDVPEQNQVNSGPFRAAIFNNVASQKTYANRVKRLATIVNGEFYSGNSCNKRSLKEEAEQSCLIHVHSHVNFDEKSPLNHSIIFNENLESVEDQLTASEICDIKFRSPSLTTIMGCNSGRSQISECNDLLGLTAALHFAGACAVISTLWKVYDKDCLMFSEAFYDSLMKQMSNREKDQSKLDLAKAMQCGVKSVMYDAKGNARAPHHWAGFILHGSTQFPAMLLS